MTDTKTKAEVRATWKSPSSEPLVELSREDMARMLEQHPEMSEATRRAILSGVPFIDGGITYRAPLDDDGRPTHYTSGRITRADGKEIKQWNN